MKVPISWLGEYVPLEMPLHELASRLSVSSAEVEGIERRGIIRATRVPIPAAVHSPDACTAARNGTG